MSCNILLKFIFEQYHTVASFVCSTRQPVGKSAKNREATILFSSPCRVRSCTFALRKNIANLCNKFDIIIIDLHHKFIKRSHDKYTYWPSDSTDILKTFINVDAINVSLLLNISFAQRMLESNLTIFFFIYIMQRIYLQDLWIFQAHCYPLLPSLIFFGRFVLHVLYLFFCTRHT